MVKKLCFECCEETQVEIKPEERTQTYNGMEITYNAEVYYCTVCGSNVPDSELFNKNLMNSYIAYKKANNYLMAEDFIYIRTTLYEITVRTLAKIIGCSPATITKYEKGAIQTQQHDQFFRLLKEPKNMKDILKNSKSKLEEDEYNKLNERLEYLLSGERTKDLLSLHGDNWSLPRIKSATINQTATYKTIEDYYLLRYRQRYNTASLDNTLLKSKIKNLAYFAQAWHLALTNKPLIKEKFELNLEDYSIYTYNYKSNQPQQETIHKSIEELSLLSSQKEILDWVWEKYNRFESDYLTELILEELPNLTKDKINLVNLKEKKPIVIENEEINSYYNDLYSALNLLKEDNEEAYTCL